METSSQCGNVRSNGYIFKRYAGLRDNRPGSQLSMNIQKQVFDRDRLCFPALMSGDVAPDDLDQVIQQKAECELEDRRFRTAADQALQMEHFRNFLEYLLDAPAVQVVLEQIVGWIRIGIQEISDQGNVRLAGPLQRDLTDVAAFAMICRSEPAPFLEECPTLGVDSRFCWAAMDPDENRLWDGDGSESDPLHPYIPPCGSGHKSHCPPKTNAFPPLRHESGEEV